MYTTRRSRKKSKGNSRRIRRESNGSIMLCCLFCQGKMYCQMTYFRRNTLLGNNLPYLMQHNSAPVEDGLIESLQSSSIQDIPVNRRHILNQRVYRCLIVLTHLHIKRGDPDSDVDESWHTILGQKHYCIYCLTVLTKQESLGVVKKQDQKGNL